MTPPRNLESATHPDAGDPTAARVGSSPPCHRRAGETPPSQDAQGGHPVGPGIRNPQAGLGSANGFANETLRAGADQPGYTTVSVLDSLVSETRRNAGDGGDVRRSAHNPEVAGSNPAPATKARGPFSNREMAFRSWFVNRFVHGALTPRLRATRGSQQLAGSCPGLAIALAGYTGHSCRLPKVGADSEADDAYPFKVGCRAVCRGRTGETGWHTARQRGTRWTTLPAIAGRPARRYRRRADIRAGPTRTRTHAGISMSGGAIPRRSHGQCPCARPSLPSMRLRGSELRPSFCAPAFRRLGAPEDLGWERVLGRSPVAAHAVSCRFGSRVRAWLAIEGRWAAALLVVRAYCRRFPQCHLVGEALDEDRAPQEEFVHGGDRSPS